MGRVERQLGLLFQAGQHAALFVARGDDEAHADVKPEERIVAY